MYFADNILTREVNQFFTLKSAPISFDGNFDTLKGYRIGAVRNYSYGNKFDTFSPKLNVLRLETENALLLNLVNKRCDIILGNSIVLALLAKQVPGGQDIVPCGPGITNDPLYIGFSKAKGHKILAEKFSDALKQFKASGAYSQILVKYGL